MRLHNYKTLAKVVDDPWTDFEECYGNKTYLFHRIDLHQGLREMAESPESEAVPGTPVKIRLGCAGAQVDVEEGTITLQDGTHLKKDFIIIADGVKVNYEWLLSEVWTMLIYLGSLSLLPKLLEKMSLWFLSGDQSSVCSYHLRKCTRMKNWPLSSGVKDMGMK